MFSEWDKKSQNELKHFKKKLKNPIQGSQKFMGKNLESSHDLYALINEFDLDEMTHFLKDGKYKAVRKEQQQIVNKINQLITKKIFDFASEVEKEQHLRLARALENCGVTKQCPMAYLKNAVEYNIKNDKRFTDAENSLVIQLTYTVPQKFTVKTYSNERHQFVDKEIEQRTILKQVQAIAAQKDGRSIDKEVRILYRPSEKTKAQELFLPYDFCLKEKMHVPSSARTEKEGLQMLELITDFRNYADSQYHIRTLK